ncbi:enoyl-[acyl-carrier-protein] reductase, mitochondrial-like [Actinia tenebrosa]|uniref:Enoyl-[acyl-carrier-protein] reductase, mitochondrial n=1 Tax=Actinia tenebrosa TaxID=6105 RepID=A0A6P8H2I7_ACTTE|nr:enoyl-[acyl-carrier-protein] reductase, mitochondrial-like [Actinia tenebrosa]
MAAQCFGRRLQHSFLVLEKLQGLFGDCATEVSRSVRRFSSVKAHALVYKEHGDPSKVLSLDFVDREVIDPNSVGVHMIAAPVNPADINQIQGTYAIKPKLPAVGGNEGFGQVIKVGKEVKDVKEGDYVILAENSLGSWSRYLVLTEHDVIQIPGNVTVEFAATLAVNPCTAYRMLKDFEQLKAGSTIIQNGANSGVGRAVIQLAAAWGIKSINIVRDRPNLEELQKELTGLGATHVVTEEFCRTPDMTKLLKDLQRPKLGFNCVGGKSATELTRRLSPQGTLVTYGGMSKQPFAVPTGSLIFNDIRIRGFWMSGWNKHNAKSEARLSMIKDICQLHFEGKFNPPPCTKHVLQDYKTAVESAMKPFSSTKQLFILADHT